MSLLDQEYLKECLQYDCGTGEFVWNVRPECHFKSARGASIFNKLYAGKPAGDISAEGYRVIVISGKPYKAHRLAWLYCFVYLPEQWLDHINRDRADNRIDNLREASPQLNAENASKRIDNISGVKGVSWHKKSGRWVVQTNSKHVGLFKRFEDAVMARWFSEELMCLGGSL